VQGRSEDEYRASVRRIFAAQPDWAHSPAASAFGERSVIAARIRRYDAILAEEARWTSSLRIGARCVGDGDREGDRAYRRLPLFALTEAAAFAVT
jgi:hypothetical protein